MTDSSYSGPSVVTFAWDDGIEDLYASWWRDAQVAARVHEVLDHRLRIGSTLVEAIAGLFAACAAAIALAPVVAPGAYIRATRGIEPDVMNVIIGSLAAAAAVLVIALAIVRPAVRAERHRASALRYRSTDRAMAAMLALPRDARPSPDGALTWARERLARYERQSPSVGRRRWARLEASSRPADTGAESARAPAPDAQRLAAT